MKVVARGKGQARFALLSMLYRKQNFSTALIDAKENIVGDRDLYWKAQALATLRGWDRVNMRDEVMGDVFRDADLEDHLKKTDSSSGGGFCRFAPWWFFQDRKVTEHKGAAGRGRATGRSGVAGRGGSACRGRKRARVGSLDVDVSDSLAVPVIAAGKHSGAAGRGRKAGRGGGAGRGSAVGRGSKRTREESIDVLVKASDSDNANVQRIS